MTTIGIVGYGNIGKAVETVLEYQPDMELGAVFTRREPGDLVTKSGCPVYNVDCIEEFKNKLDVLILCGGSATDLPVQGPEFARHFNIVDSYDNHSRIPQYFEDVNKTAVTGGNVAVISIGWDPGLFSVMRLLFGSVLPQGSGTTFWGRGVSQGHSDAVRRVEGVADAVQYTVPIEQAIEDARSGKAAELTTRQKHLRECYVVAKDGANKKAITKSICEMPAYFADYDTTVNFISQEELNEKHKAMPHGGFVLQSGITGEGNSHTMEFSLKLDSNPEFTASVLVAYARAADKLSGEGKQGAMTIYDIPLGYISPMSSAELRKNIL